MPKQTIFPTIHAERLHGVGEWSGESPPIVPRCSLEPKSNPSQSKEAEFLDVPLSSCL